jgi:hypothetical protein
MYMRRFLSVIVLCLLASVFASAAQAQAVLVPVRATHQRVYRHRAHKAGKHRVRRHRRSV